MPYDYFKTEKELEDRFYVFSTLLKRYVDVISGNDRWFLIYAIKRTMMQKRLILSTDLMKHPNIKNLCFQ